MGHTTHHTLSCFLTTRSPPHSRIPFVRVSPLLVRIRLEKGPATMSAQENKPTTKKFGKGERSVPHPSQKASKWYPAHTESAAKKSRKSIRPAKYRSSLQPGTVLILLAGRFRGKRVILLKQLSQGALLVTGPFKINGVPLRRVNARYVIATSTNVPIDSIDKSTVEKVGKPEYFAHDRKADKNGSEEGFFAQQEGKGAQKKEVSSARAEDQKKVDEGLVKAIKKESLLREYLKSQWSLRKGDKPHEMVF